MRLSEKHTIVHRGCEVEVSCDSPRLNPPPAHNLLIKAKIGETVYEHSHTIGPVDGELILPTREQLKADLEYARKCAVKHAHFRHHVDSLLSEL